MTLPIEVWGFIALVFVWGVAYSYLRKRAEKAELSEGQRRDWTGTKWAFPKTAEGRRFRNHALVVLFGGMAVIVLYMLFVVAKIQYPKRGGLNDDGISKSDRR